MIVGPSRLVTGSRPVVSNVLNYCKQHESLIQRCRFHLPHHSFSRNAHCISHRIGTLPKRESSVRG